MTTSQESQPRLAQYDELWLDQLNQAILQHLNNPMFKVEDLIDPMMTSRRKLYRRVKKVTGLPPSRYIRKLRLEKARELLEIGVYPTVQEVAWAVGYQRSDYFSELYERVYLKRPIWYLK